MVSSISITGIGDHASSVNVFPPGKPAPDPGPQTSPQNYILQSRTMLFSYFPHNEQQFDVCQLVSWGQAPKPPGSASPRVALCGLLRSRTTLFASFSGKRRVLLDQFVTNISIRSLGASSQTPKVGFAEVWAIWPSATQNNAFCFFFWEKKGIARPINQNSTDLQSSCNAFCFFFWKKKTYTHIHDGIITIRSRDFQMLDL
jgi:hypothetical protein